MKYHTLKTNLLIFLDKMPDNIGYSIYHKIQKFLFKNIESNIVANKNSIEKIIAILAKHDKTINEKNVLEIGSGWMPLMPYFLKYLGKCKDVYTYDINEHYDRKYILKLNNYFKTNYHIEFRPGNNNKYLLPDFIKYNPKRDIITSDLPGKIDIVFSRFVLEHVRPEDIFSMHRRFYEEFEKNTIFLHLISPSDHRAYTDSSISHYDFLKYSQDEWDKIQTKFDYHNRLRLPQYLEIFEKAGFEVIHLEYDDVKTDSKKYLAFKKLKLHKDFLTLTEKEILASSINVLLRKH